MKIAFLLFITSILAYANQTPSEFMEAWVAEYNNNDADAISTYYDQSEDTDCLVSAGLWLRGYKEIKAMYKQDMHDAHFYDSRAEAMKHRIIEDIALVSFIHKFKYYIKAEKLTYRIHIRTTATLRKNNQSWKIVAEHSSPIQGIERAVLIENEDLEIVSK